MHTDSLFRPPSPADAAAPHCTLTALSAAARLAACHTGCGELLLAGYFADGSITRPYAKPAAKGAECRTAVAPCSQGDCSSPGERASATEGERLLLSCSWAGLAMERRATTDWRPEGSGLPSSRLPLPCTPGMDTHMVSANGQHNQLCSRQPTKARQCNVVMVVLCMVLLQWPAHFAWSILRTCKADAAG